MPRFFFHLDDSAGVTDDTEGCSLADNDAALARARRVIREMIAQEVRETGDIRLDRAIDIVRSDRDVNVRLRFADAVSLHLPR